MSNQILLQSMTPDELGVLITDAIKNQINALKTNPESNNLLTREEAADFLSITSSTLWSYTRTGKLISYSIGSRRYYKKNELLESLTKVTTK